MDTKMFDTANLDNKRIVFWQIGIIIALLVVFLVFEWSSKPDYFEPANTDLVAVNFDVKYISRGQSAVKPKPAAEPFVDMLDIVADSVQITSELNPAIFNNLDNSVQAQLNTLVAQNVTELADVEPQFVGGDKQLKEYIKNAITYPEDAYKHSIQGKVYVKFLITKQGKIEHASIVRSIAPDLDREALRIIRSLPAWKPGYRAGKPINTWYALPITFIIDEIN